MITKLAKLTRIDRSASPAQMAQDCLAEADGLFERIAELHEETESYLRQARDQNQRHPLAA